MSVVLMGTSAVELGSIGTGRQGFKEVIGE